MTHFVRTPYNYDRNQASRKSALRVHPDETRTQQQFKDDADINVIVRRFGLTGQLPENYRAPLMGDFTDVPDYQTALNAVIAADRAFLQIPANVRERFANNPQKLMEFLADENNRDEAMKLGLLQKPPEVDRTGTAVVQPAPGTPPAQGNQP